MLLLPVFVKHWDISENTDEIWKMITEKGTRTKDDFRKVSFNKQQASLN